MCYMEIFHPRQVLINLIFSCVAPGFPGKNSQDPGETCWPILELVSVFVCVHKTFSISSWMP